MPNASFWRRASSAAFPLLRTTNQKMSVFLLLFQEGFKCAHRSRTKPWLPRQTTQAQMSNPEADGMGVRTSNSLHLGLRLGCILPNPVATCKHL